MAFIESGMKASELEQKALAELGAGIDDCHETIRRKYRHLVMQFHPDRNPNNPEAKERCIRIMVAYDILCKNKNGGQKKTQEEIEMEQYIWSLYESFWPVSDEYKADRLQSLKQHYQAKLCSPKEN